MKDFDESRRHWLHQVKVFIAQGRLREAELAFAAAEQRLADANAELRKVRGS